MQTPLQTATLQAVMLMRMKQSRARVSETTLKMLAGRRHLRADFVVDVMKSMADLNWIMIELDAGGFGLITRKALEGAKSVLVEDSLTDSEQKAIKGGVFTLAKFEDELRLASDEACPVKRPNRQGTGML